jgi:preprotein translocase subunit SecG
MSNIQTALLIVHTLIALSIIALVLLQRGKGAEAGAAFGAGASGTVFGARGSTNFFSRTTAILATLFFASSLALAFMSSQGPAEGPKSIIESAAPVENTVPPVDDTGSIPDLP